MCTHAITEPARLSTSEAAEKWNETRRKVAAWCRDGHIQGARKDRRGNTAWSIPCDAKRPIDSKIIRELLWQIVEKGNGTISQLDVTDWGIPIADIDGCIQTLINNDYLAIAADTGDVRLLKKGIQLLGRLRDGESKQVPEILTWTMASAGIFTGSLVKAAMLS